MAMGVEAGVVDLRRNGFIRVMGETHRDGELSGEAGAKLSKRISRRLAAQVAGKLARRRAYVILGRELPILGVGLAAGYNFWSTRKLGHAARAYFHHVSKRGGTRGSPASPSIAGGLFVALGEERGLRLAMTAECA